MGNQKEPKERRRHRRFLAKDSVFAVCIPTYVRLGRVVDISRGGVAFHYIPDFGDDKAFCRKSLNLDVFETESSRYLKGVECNIVYDAEAPRLTSVCDAYQFRRCGVEFGGLSRDQSSELDFIIENFTAEKI
jgi:hypothetical protein